MTQIVGIVAIARKILKSNWCCHSTEILELGGESWEAANGQERWECSAGRRLLMIARRKSGNRPMPGSRQNDNPCGSRFPIAYLMRGTWWIGLAVMMVFLVVACRDKRQKRHQNIQSKVISAVIVGVSDDDKATYLTDESGEVLSSTGEGVQRVSGSKEARK